MIPKIIHYCWFGNGEKNELIQKCIESWKRVCPDYKIVEWNESNFDVNCITYTKIAYKEKKYAHVTDYARLKIIYENGGIYLDTDVELIASPDCLLNDCAFFALQNAGEVATGLGFGAVKGTTVLKELMKSYEKKIYNDGEKILTETCVDTDSKVFDRLGMKKENKNQALGDIKIYSSDYFNPKNFETDAIHITKNTIGIHHYNMSWYDETELLIRKKLRSLTKKYDENTAKIKFGKWYKRNHIRLVLKRYGFIGTVKKLIDKIH